MNQYLVEFDVWLKVWEQDIFYRQQCAIAVWADSTEEAAEKAKETAKWSIFTFPPHIFHHFGNGTKVHLINDTEKESFVSKVQNFANKTFAFLQD